MPRYYIDVGSFNDGIVLSARVEAATEEEAVAAFKEMLEYRLGKDDDCSFCVDGGRIGESKSTVGMISVCVNTEAIDTGNIVEEYDD